MAGVTTKVAKAKRNRKRSLLVSARFRAKYWERVEELKLELEKERRSRLESETAVSHARSYLRSTVNGLESCADMARSLRTKLQMVAHEQQHVSRSTCFMVEGIDRELLSLDQRIGETFKYGSDRLNDAYANAEQPAAGVQKLG